jgi:hypothetical protein
MKTLLLNTLLISLSLFVTSCGSKKETPINRITKKPDEKLIDSSSLIFMDKDVPAHVGQILNMDKSKNGEELSTCTGSIIHDKRTVLTNRHCIPEYIVKKPSTCGDRLHIAFNVNGTTVLRKCKRLIEIPTKAQYAAGDNDYAVFELDQPVNVNPLEFNIDGINNLADVSIYSVNLFNRGSYYQSKLRTNHCTSRFTPFFEYAGPHNSTATLFGKTKSVSCDVIEGNSGSALINTNTGKAIGVVYAIFDKDTRDRLDLSNPGQAMVYQATEKVNTIAYASPLSMIKFFNPAGLTPAQIIDSDDLFEEIFINAFHDKVFPGQNLKDSFKYIRLDDNDDILKLLNPNNTGLTYKGRAQCLEKEYARDVFPNHLKAFDFAISNAKIEYDEYLIPKLTGYVYQVNIYNGQMGDDSEGMFLEYDQGAATYIKLRQCLD